jgi:hypothetical protein
MIFMRQLIKHGTRQKVSLFTCVPGKWLPINKWVRKKKPLNQQLSEVEQQAPVHLTDHAKEETLIQQHSRGGFSDLPLEQLAGSTRLF